MTPPSKPLLALVLLGACATAFLAGRQTAPPADERVLQELASQRAVLDTLVARASPSADANERILRELTSQRAMLDTLLARTAPAPALRHAPGAPDASLPSSAPTSTEPSSENLAAAREGQRLIDAALRVKRWTNEDAQAFRAALVDMTPDQRTEALRQLLTTLNSQALSVQTRGAPF